MKRFLRLFTITVCIVGICFGQTPKQPTPDDVPIRISTELVQIDVVVTDKFGKIVKGLARDDFQLSERGKKQTLSFFEYVEGSAKPKRGAAPATQVPTRSDGLTEGEVNRIVAFIVDDLTTRPEDLIQIRQMLTGFVDNRMLPNDLVAIIRTIGGRGLLQQFTSDKDLLRRAIASLTPVTNPYNIFNRNERERLPAPNEALAGPTSETPTPNSDLNLGLGGHEDDIASVSDETNSTLRSFMSLGTASFIVDSMKQLPGRKSVILISGGLPILGVESSTSRTTNTGQPIAVQPSGLASPVTQFLSFLADRATRAGVVIHTMDIRGLSGQTPVASFTATPGRSSLDTPNLAFGRVADESQLGDRNPLDTLDAQMGLKALAEDTGGIAILNKNDFDQGLNKILDASEAYYLLAYTPTDGKFDGDFRRVEVKVRGEGYRVYSRRGYVAREEKVSTEPVSPRDQMLNAIKSPLARREIDVEAMVLYKANPDNSASIDLHMMINPSRLQFVRAGEKQQANLEVAGFVFDQLGKLRGGFSETIVPNVSDDEFKRISKGGISYSANTTLSPGIYQIRLGGP